MYEEYFALETEYLPWLDHSEETLQKQVNWQMALKQKYDADFAPGAFISTLAKVYGILHLRVGKNSFIGAECLIRVANLVLGENCSINSGSYLQGDIQIGNDVRIAPHVKIIGMNHNIADPHVPIYTQGVSHRGIVIEHDVWIGAGATVLDGVRIGAHSVVGAGAVVTKDVPPYSIAVGNPARVVRNRLEVKKGTGSTVEITAFCEKVRAQIPKLLDYYTKIEHGQKMFLNTPDAAPSTRAFCDAVEILGMFDLVEDWPDKAYLTEAIRERQTPQIDYDVLTVGYALEVLQSSPKMPFSEVEKIVENLQDWLDNLPWQENAWGAGAQIDHLSTALYFNQVYFNTSFHENALFRWLREKQNPITGLWGSTKNGDLLLSVNGFYRLARGSFAQFDVLLPQAETIIDSIFKHLRNKHDFRLGDYTACNILDVIHPLWLCAKQTTYRLHEGIVWANAQIAIILSQWQDNRGFAFELNKGVEPTLQGTEMWLAILYYLCAYTEKLSALTYAPKGVHRASF